jgi:hypothetical protein
MISNNKKTSRSPEAMCGKEGVMEEEEQAHRKQEYEVNGT